MKLKSLFIALVIPASTGALFYAAYMLSQAPSMGWVGAVVASAPIPLFMAYLFVGSVSTTPANLNVLTWPAAVGAAMASADAVLVSGVGLPLILAVVIGFAGCLLYVFWYSKLDRSVNNDLVVGKKLPEISLKNETGDVISTADIARQPSLMIFYRGNWCPLCMAQIKEVAGQYKVLSEKGVKIYLVSPQPHENTRALSERFDVDFNFLVDEGGKVARQLNIIAEDGLPTGLQALGYESDTVMPTVVMTGAQGEIIFVDLTDNYRVRPEPEVFLKVFAEAGI